VFGNRRSGSGSCPQRLEAKTVDDPISSMRLSAFRAYALANSTAPGGIGISRGQHAQQGRPTAGSGRLPTTSHASDSACPFKPSMHRCGFLGLRFIHRQKLPTSRNATQTTGPRSTNPLGRKEPEFPPATPSWPRSTRFPRRTLGWRGKGQLPIILIHDRNSSGPHDEPRCYRARSRAPSAGCESLSHRTKQTSRLTRNKTVSGQFDSGSGMARKGRGQRFPPTSDPSSSPNCNRPRHVRLAKITRNLLDLLSAWWPVSTAATDAPRGVCSVHRPGTARVPVPACLTT
jgi:hypothetical protein